MVNGIRASNPRGLDKGHGSKFRAAPGFDKKRLKKAGGHIGRNVVNKTIVRKH